MSGRTTRRLQAGAVAVAVTFAGIALFIIVTALALSFVEPVIGTAVWIPLFVVGGAISVALGRVIRWLADTQ